MTIEEAIKHCEEVAIREKSAADGCRYWTDGMGEETAKKCEKCAEEHQQLAEWLKAYRESIDKTEAFNKFIKRFQDIDTRPYYKVHNPYWWECYYEIEELLNECLEEVEDAD